MSCNRETWALYRCIQVCTPDKMVNLPDEFLSLLSTSSLVHKRAMLVAISDSIREDESAAKNNHAKLSEYVEYVPSYISDDTDIAGIELELDSMKLKSPNSKKTKSFWLNSSNGSYTYSGETHQTHLISNFPFIKELMDKLNNDENLECSNLDSCLVTCYSTAKKSLNLHADDEKEICQLSSICNVSIGGTRTIEFLPKHIPNFKGDPVCSFDLEDCSVNIMKPGCQQVLKHRVIPGVHQIKGKNLRYCLSFRKYVNVNTNPVSPIKDNIKFFETLGNEKQDSKCSTNEPLDYDNQLINTVLFAGDSHFTKLDPDLLGKEKVNVINIAKGGLRICDTEATISDFCVNNSSFNIIKVFISVGTNDIRHCRRGVLHLTKPLKLLSERIHLCFPNAIIYYQSLFPLPLINPFVRSNVECFNRLLLDTCRKYQIYYLNVFERFLGPNRHRNPELFQDQVNNVHLNNAGLCKLAKILLYKIHNKSFNPWLH